MTTTRTVLSTMSPSATLEGHQRRQQRQRQRRCNSVRGRDTGCSRIATLAAGIVASPAVLSGDYVLGPGPSLSPGTLSRCQGPVQLVVVWQRRCRFGSVVGECILEGRRAFLTPWGEGGGTFGRSAGLRKNQTCSVVSAGCSCMFYTQQCTYAAFVFTSRGSAYAACDCFVCACFVTKGRVVSVFGTPCLSCTCTITHSDCRGRVGVLYELLACVDVVSTFWFGRVLQKAHRGTPAAAVYPHVLRTFMPHGVCW
jgi:hypothetical protein